MTYQRTALLTPVDQPQIVLNLTCLPTAFVLGWSVNSGGSGVMKRYSYTVQIRVICSSYWTVTKDVDKGNEFVAL